MVDDPVSGVKQILVTERQLKYVNNQLISPSSYNDKDMAFLYMDSAQSDITIPVQTNDEVSLYWHVLTHLNLERFRTWFDGVNAARLSEEKRIIQSFYPYDFFGGCNRDRREAVETEHQETAVKVDAHKVLRRFVFLKGTKDEIRELLYSEANLMSSTRLRRYLDPSGEQAYISNDEMSRFLQSCIEYRECFELCPSENSISAMDKVRIKKGLYKGYEATVVRVKLSKGQLILDLTLPMLTGNIDILMKGVLVRDVTPLSLLDAAVLREDFIRHAQDSVLEILHNRAFLLENPDHEKVKQADNFRRDADLLQQLLRYRDYEIETISARAHFKALMLICAHLSKDARMEAQLRQDALELLDLTKKDSDAHAYLLVALKVSTDNPQYRDDVKDYIRRCQPKSERLRSFVKLICKKVRY